MATATLYQAFNCLEAQDWYWTMDESYAVDHVQSSNGDLYTLSSIKISDGSHTQIFNGTITVNINTGDISGTVNSSSYWLNGTKVYSVSGISLSASKMATFADTYGDTQATYSYVFSGADVMNGSAYADTILGYAGNDTIYGGNGNDVLKGVTGADKLYGGSGNDTMDGGSENDSLLGGAGSDLLKGVSGSDTLIGGSGSDRLYGGADTVKDVFDFNYVSESTSTSRDKIYDFKTGIDKIDLNGIDANTNLDSNQNFLAFNSKTAAAYKVWYVTADADADGAVDDVIIRGDVNGNTSADFEIAVIGVTTLAAGDFLL